MQNMNNSQGETDRTGEGEWFGSVASAILNAIICTPLIYGAYINIGTGRYIAVAVCVAFAMGTAYLGIMDIIDIVDEIKGAREEGHKPAKHSGSSSTQEN